MNSKSLRKHIYTIIFKTNTYWGRVFDELLILAILLSTASIILSSVTSLNAIYWKSFEIINLIITVLFSIEYVLRIYAHPKPLKYIMSFYWIIDLLAIIPWLMWWFVWWNKSVILRGLRLFRLFRIFNLSKYHNSWSSILQSLLWCKEKIIAFLLWVLIAVSLIWTTMFVIEWPAAWFDNIPLWIYRAIVTITTVWYGDITPVTPVWKILASLLMLMWYWIITIPTGIISAELAVASERRKQLWKNSHHAKK